MVECPHKLSYSIVVQFPVRKAIGWLNMLLMYAFRIPCPPKGWNDLRFTDLDKLNLLWAQSYKRFRRLFRRLAQSTQQD